MRETVLECLNCGLFVRPENLKGASCPNCNKNLFTIVEAPAAPAAAEPMCKCGHAKTSHANEGCYVLGCECEKFAAPAAAEGDDANTDYVHPWPIDEPLAEPVPQSEPLDVIELCERVRATIINTVREHFQHGLNIDRREWLEEKLTERVDETLDGIHSLAAPSPAETSQVSADAQLELSVRIDDMIHEHLRTRGAASSWRLLALRLAALATPAPQEPRK